MLRGRPGCGAAHAGDVEVTPYALAQVLERALEPGCSGTGSVFVAFSTLISSAAGCTCTRSAFFSSMRNGQRARQVVRGVVAHHQQVRHPEGLDVLAEPVGVTGDAGVLVHR